MSAPMTSTAMTSAPSGRRGSAMLAPITWLRVVGAFAVLVFHAYQHSAYTGMTDWTGGAFWHRALVLMAAGGVDAFFVVTMFLSARAVVRGALGEGPVASGRTLLRKRAVTLLPVYVVAVLVVWALSNPRLPGHWADLVLHLTFTQVYSDDYIFWTLGPAWFIAVSMHFYLLLAVIGGPLQRWCRRMGSRAARVRALLAVAGALAAVSWAYKLVMHFGLERPVDSWSTWFGPLSRLDLMALGLVLAVLAVLRPALPRWAVVASFVTAGVLLVGTGLTFPENTPDWWPHGTMGLAAFLYLLPSVTDRRVRTADGVAAVVTPGGRVPGSWAGGIALLSYGVYIWQEPVLRVLDAYGFLPPDSSDWAFPVTTVLMLVATLAVAWLSYHLLEVPGRAWAAWSERSAPTPSAPAVPVHEPALAGTAAR
ncbi:acyltransferase family protein [Modestobacter roseus]|uniref:Peptidoglycan/LPS O-acetylase OafA/YrhL n=1 Tax=Modestobacter roseus TaxID=1181884 RepID=A0A562IWY9_9ACTN|nr:acyltransferase [Modestobacter roseus]MQA35971.1 acyltransferase family protein [Modestobacter roseus]TWH75343.1 peptidoglycan/LPS O-acetylase OafA/YrhL [Modestobacter roseus]